MPAISLNSIWGKSLLGKGSYKTAQQGFINRKWIIETILNTKWREAVNSCLVCFMCRGS